ncbi:MAG: hypothetical protein QOJ79_1267 [Actinomycetota bacterium]|nr:hypothetical protein [Actinomycetota bacterium]
MVPYDGAWRSRARRLEERLRDLLGDQALAIDHIGSTSVAGLAARPITDIQVSVADICDQASFRPALEAGGYRRLRVPELDVDDYLVFVPVDGSNTEHVEVCERGSFQELRHLAVRDYLRAHPGERSAYEQAKRSAATKARGDRARYSAGKDAFVTALERRALAWAAGSARPEAVCERAPATQPR